MNQFKDAINWKQIVRSSQGYLLQGLAYQQMNQFKDAVTSLLTALELDPDNADKLTNHIAATVSRFCNISKDLAKSLKGEGKGGGGGGGGCLSEHLCADSHLKAFWF